MLNSVLLMIGVWMSLWSYFFGLGLLCDVGQMRMNCEMDMLFCFVVVMVQVVVSDEVSIVGLLYFVRKLLVKFLQSVGEQYSVGWFDRLNLGRLGVMMWQFLVSVENILWNLLDDFVVLILWRQMSVGLFLFLVLMYDMFMLCQ